MKKIVVKEIPYGLWVFKDMIKFVDKKVDTGAQVFIKYKNRIIGSGFFNPDSSIRVRLYSYKKELFSLPLLQSRISDAFRFRKNFGLGDSYRLVFGESDFLPGLIIDRYRSCLVIQTLSVGMQKRIPMVVEVLKNIFNPVLIYQKDNSPLRQLEGMGSEEKILWGKIPKDLWIEQDGLKFYVDIMDGQKTGFYLDQRINRQKVMGLSRGRSVLDLFTYSGAFAIYAAKGGAERVLGVDQSKSGVELAHKNADANNLKCSFIEAEVFQFLEEYKEDHDLIIIDPPSFTRKKRSKDRALKGYRKLFRLAIEHINPYGYIILSSCSHYITMRDLIGVVNNVSRGARKKFRLFEVGHQASDHPVFPGMPETEYLRCLYLQSF